MTPILAATGIVKNYESNGASHPALRGVELAVEEGEFVAVMGPSGCGKSTLLHILGGIERPDSGEVRLRGTRVDILSEGQAARLRRREVGYVFQFFNLIGNLSVADNVELPALMAGAKAKEAKSRRMQLLEELGVSDRAALVPGKLSGGEQQRVAIARGLIHNPAVLLADEPTGNLDSAAARDVVEMLKRSHSRGQTIVLVTHDPRVASTANRVLTMRDGQIVRETKLETGRDPRQVLPSLIQMEA